MWLRAAGLRPTVYPLPFLSCSFAASRSKGWDRPAFCLVSFSANFGQVTWHTIEYCTDVAKCMTLTEHTHFPGLCCQV